MSISGPITHPQNSCHPSSHSPQIPPIKMTTNNLHEANEVGACWYMGDTLLACKLIERKEILDDYQVKHTIINTQNDIFLLLFKVVGFVVPACESTNFSFWHRE